jgi:hypothetical protein
VVAIRRERASLRALTAAALALPGLGPSAAAGAEDDAFGFRFTRYREGERKLYGVNSRYDPIEVDSLQASGRTTLLDRFELGFDYVQDTWSGATPVTTAPLLLGGNRPTAPDGVSGATPLIQGDLFLDSALRPVELDDFGVVVRTDRRDVHTLSSASPETRKQGSLQLGYDFGSLYLDGGGGLSWEDDYESWFGSVGARVDLFRERTSVELRASYTMSDIAARLDHDAVPYIDTGAFQHEIHVYPASGDRELRDGRDDHGIELGLVQVLGRSSFVSTRVGYARASGYLENPYRVMQIGFIDPAQQFRAPPGGYYAQVLALLEQRPNSRQQWTWDTRYVHYVEPLGAALHLGYRLFLDDWGIDAHTVEASLGQPLGKGWTLTPRVRFYSQDEADFYGTLLLTPQAYQTIVVDPDTGDILSITPFDRRLLPDDFSSDQRLSAYGALSGGLTLAKQFARGLRVEADVEYYTHAGDLRFGGGGEADYADFDYWQVGVTLELDATALHAFGYRRRQGPRAHAGHAGAPAPAGVMLAHALEPGALMLGYRHVWSRQGGSMLHGASSVRDSVLLTRACEGAPCRTTPDEMDMFMHMLELGWAPSRRLTLLAMPQLVDMTMDMRPIPGATPDVHGSHDHRSGGIGDLPVFALLRVLDLEGHHLHVGVGVSVPLGEVDLDLRRTHQEERGRQHYGMQLGSGTWDLLPSATYTGQLAAFSWGAQVGGTKRLERENDEGYSLGDGFQATAWAGRRVTDWLSLSLRGVYTRQDSISGRYDKAHDDSGPPDFPSNYGGEYWDLGVGASVDVASGYLEGNHFALEWLEPLRDDVDGYQLERKGSLVLAWSVAF